MDFRTLANIVGCQNVKLASPKEVQKVTGFGVGSVPMVGLDIPCVIDQQLFKYDFVYGGTGASTFTLNIEPHALTLLNHVVAVLEE